MSLDSVWGSTALNPGWGHSIPFFILTVPYPTQVYEWARANGGSDTSRN